MIITLVLSHHQDTQLDPVQLPLHSLVLQQEVRGSQAEGPHHPAVEATGQDLPGGVEGHSTRSFLCS